MFERRQATHPAGRRRAGIAGIAGALLTAALASSSVVAVAGASTPGTPKAAGRATLTDPYANDWQSFHGGALLDGYASNSSLSTANAPGLGVRWAADLYGPALDSPVVAYNSTLAEEVAYIGTENGDVIAVDVATGQEIWGTFIGGPIRTSLLVRNGRVYAGTFDSPRIYALDDTTGAVDCSAISPMPIEGTFAYADPPGGVGTVYIGTNDSQVASGPIVAMNAADCHVEWEFTGYVKRTGNWAAIGYAVDATGEPLIVFGTADPDSKVYAVDAVTGKLVWDFQTDDPSPGTYDVGAGVTISPPGANGFADGVAYVPNKYGIMYALDLTTGAEIWSYDFNAVAGTTEGGRSTAALDGNNLVFGYSGGLFDLDAATGALIWMAKDPSGTEAISSPAIAGSAGQEIVAVGDVAGMVDVLSLATGAILYTYQTGGYITASPAVSGGDIIIASTDGFLYDFAVGGGNETSLPSTTVTSPADGADLPNPDGSLTLSGTAADTLGVAGVSVAIQTGGPNGQWWDAAANSGAGAWTSGPVGNPATLSSPGQPSSGWSLALPVPTSGGTYQVTAGAESTGGQSDIKGGHSSFTVAFNTHGPHVVVSPVFVQPGRQVGVRGGGFGKGETVSVALDGTLLGTITASATGYVAEAHFKIPAKEPFGPASVTATGEITGWSATAPVYVTNDWTQFGYNSSHDGLEPNDATLYNLIHPGSGLFVDPAWRFAAASAVDSSPAVVDGVAYVGDTTGHLYAVDVRTGSQIWSYTLASGAAIDGSPAVDPAKGLVFFGANDGSLTALALATGALAWTRQVGGDLSAPNVSGGDVYVASSSGNVAEISESTGVPLWSLSLGSPLAGAPALDPSAGVLVVTEQDGTVDTLDASSGAVRWTFSAAATIDSPPTVYEGRVFVASTGGVLYALAETSGAKDWSYQANAAIASNIVVSGELTPSRSPDVYFGADDGKLYVVTASTGTFEYTVPFASHVVGVAALMGVIVCETSAGVVGATRSYTALNLWHFHTLGALATAPVVVNGAIYVGAGDGNLYAFTSYGQPPV